VDVIAKNRLDLAVVLLTYNEELHLRRALQSVSTLAREIFVIDSFSTDSTLEIATSFGAYVVQRQFAYHAEQFAWALDNMPISAQWVMRLDADEIIEDDLAEEIAQRLPRLEEGITGVALRRKTIFQGRFLRHGGRFPVTLLRIWRRGKAAVEDRRMDEHLFLTEGKSVTFSGGFADYSLLNLSAFTDKHNRYATREALEALNTSLHFLPDRQNLTTSIAPRQARMKRFLKDNVYNRIPFEVSAFAYFVYRYLFLLGFLDGREGLVYHVLQGFWYRFLVGAKLREIKAVVRGVEDKEELRLVIARITQQEFNEPVLPR